MVQLINSLENSFHKIGVVYFFELLTLISFQELSRPLVVVAWLIDSVWVLELHWVARLRNFEKGVGGQAMEEVPTEIEMMIRRAWRTCLAAFYPRDKVSSISSAVSSWAVTPPPTTTITISNSRLVPLLSSSSSKANVLANKRIIKKYGVTQYSQNVIVNGPHH